MLIAQTRYGAMRCAYCALAQADCQHRLVTVRGHERGPNDELKLQFEAIRQFDEEDRKMALEILEALILRPQAKRMVQRSQGQAATKDTAKAARGGG